MIVLLYSLFVESSQPFFTEQPLLTTSVHTNGKNYF